MFKCVKAFLVAVLFMSVSGANAAFITYTSVSAWDTAVGASTVEDFNSITTVTSFTTTPLTVGNLTLSGFTPNHADFNKVFQTCLLYTSPSPRDRG